MVAQVRSEGSHRNRVRRDAGVSLIEQLIAITLMGTVVASLLTAVQVTTSASSSDRDHANLYAWLQAASDEVHNGPRVKCTAGRAAVIASYDALVQQAEPPSSWNGSASIRVTNVQFLGRSGPNASFEWSDNFCFESTAPGGTYWESPLTTQKVTIRAEAPGGRMEFVLETIKSD